MLAPQCPEGFCFILSLSDPIYMPETNHLNHRLLVLQRILLHNFYRLLGSFNTRLQPLQHFSIKAGYHDADRAESFDDRQNMDEWQLSVYETALSVLKEINGKTIIDVGCGSAYKLMHLFGSYETIGVELKETCDWLDKKYPGKKWMPFEVAKKSQLKADLIICSDVIEHLKNPDELMEFLKGISCSCLVMSTPERDLVRGNRDFGPPENPSHYREWNETEFYHYVSKWFHVKTQIITKDKSVSQVVICFT